MYWIGGLILERSRLASGLPRASTRRRVPPLCGPNCGALTNELRIHHRTHGGISLASQGEARLAALMMRGLDNSTFQSSIPVAADITVGVFYSLFGVCSLCGNGMLLYVSYKRKHLLKPAEFFIINLAISDLGMTISLYPLAVTSSLAHRWLYGRTVCVIYAFCGVLFGICSLTTLTILSTVCCLKVCYPLHGNRFSYEHGRVLIACAWAYALVFACSPLAYWGQYGPEPYGTACCIDWGLSNHDSIARSYITVLFIACYLLPCTIIIISYTRILLTVRDSRRAVEQHVSAQTRMGNIQNIIVKLSVAVCIGFFSAWSPYALVSMWAGFGHFEDIPPLAFAVPAMFAKSSTLYNPLIYLLLKPNFRHLLWKDMRSLRGTCVHHCLRLSRCSYRPRLALGVQRRGRSISESVGGAMGSCYCSCEKCNDPFEQFKHYPRHCPVNVNTVQLSLQDSTELEPELVRGPRVMKERRPKSQPMEGKKSVRVIVRGRKCSEIDSLEITLETVPAYGNAAKNGKP
ncbi:opsin 7, group member a [Misgurnus anguillicaudatus]|uniref:opsin 7, group member a n=1 Tax=Misgurnus anguillicaudatus TaxID=75329 RepID=UPI003CCFD8A6